MHVVGFILVVWFVRAQRGGRWVYSGSFGSFGCNLGGRWVHSGSLGLLKFVLGVSGFVRSRWVH